MMGSRGGGYPRMARKWEIDRGMALERAIAGQDGRLQIYWLRGGLGKISFIQKQGERFAGSMYAIFP